MDISKLLSGQVVLEETKSPINGQIKVVKDLVFGTYIQVNGLTQSGGIINSIWGKTIKKVQGFLPVVDNSLILGLGGGTAASYIRKYYPNAKITGVDIDPLIVKAGKKYLGLGDFKVDIVIDDAKSLSSQLVKGNKRFDLILVDTYCGYDYPTKFESEIFLKTVRKLLTPSGIAIFNRLYIKDKRSSAVKFGDKLEKIFSKVEWFYPEANLMFLAKNF